LLHRVFDRVVDNGRVLRTMFQMIRSGQFGRSSLSSSLQRAFQRWLNKASVDKLLSASIGSNPSLRDVLRMARPTPKDILRRNPDSIVIPFDTAAYEAKVDPGDTILSLAERLAKYGGGGTDGSLPLREANGKYAKRRFAGCVLVSDNESWVGAGRYGSTAVMTEWQKFIANQQRLGVRRPKLVCIDIQPYGTTQAPERADILNIGGFSDAVFQVVASYLTNDAARFVAEVEAIEL
jgi:hypothetical protein